jgi:hypothetical protein
MNEFLKEDVEALKTRVKALEEVVNDQILPEMRTNTALCEVIDARTDELHSAFMAPGTGIKAKNDRMYEAFVMAENGVKFITRVGNGAMWVADRGRKVGQAIFWIAAGGGAIVALAKGERIADWIVKAFA